MIPRIRCARALDAFDQDCVEVTLVAQKVARPCAEHHAHPSRIDGPEQTRVLQRLVCREDSELITAGPAPSLDGRQSGLERSIRYFGCKPASISFSFEHRYGSNPAIPGDKAPPRLLTRQTEAGYETDPSDSHAAGW